MKKPVQASDADSSVDINDEDANPRCDIEWRQGKAVIVCATLGDKDRAEASLEGLTVEVRDVAEEAAEDPSGECACSITPKAG